MASRCPTCRAPTKSFMGVCPSCGASLSIDGELARDTNEATALTSTNPAPSNRRWAWFALATVAAVVAAGTVWATTRGSDDPARATPANQSAFPFDSASTVVSLPPPLQPAPVSTSALLVTATNRGAPALIIRPVDGGAASSVSVPDYEPGQSITRLLGAGSTVIAMVKQQDGSGSIWSFGREVLAGHRAPIKLGSGNDVFVDARGGLLPRVTIVNEAFGSTAVRSVAVDGSGSTAVIPTPLGYRPQAAVYGGYVLAGSEADTGQPTLRVWNPDGWGFIADIGTGQSPLLMAAAAYTVVWREDTGSRPAVHAFNVQSMRDDVISIGDGIVGYESDRPAASPDGGHVAFGLESGNIRFSLAVLDVVNHQLNVQALGTQPADYEWSPDSSWLFVHDEGVFLYGPDARPVSNLADGQGDTGISTVVLVG